MLKINFLPESDIQDSSGAVREYETIWNTDGQRIVDVWQKITGYEFRESFINATVFKAKSPSQSHPLNLKGSLSYEEKKSTLVHELGHRILFLPRREILKNTKVMPTSLENHKLLYLVLYDVYEMLYGKDFVEYAIKYERDNLPALYGEAWDFALQFKTKEERQEKFREMMAA